MYLTHLFDLKGAQNQFWLENTEGHINKEWIVPTKSIMICVELAQAIYPVLAPYPQKILR